MQIRTVWESTAEDDIMPWIIAAVDEYTIEEHGGSLPEFYQKELKPGRRELIITIPDADVRKLFALPTVTGKTKEVK